MLIKKKNKTLKSSRVEQGRGRVLCEKNEWREEGRKQKFNKFRPP